MGRRAQWVEPTVGALVHFTYAASTAGAVVQIKRSTEEDVSIDAE